MRVLSLLLILTLAACASGGPRRGAPLQAYEVRLQEQFTAADVDGDEQLTVDEYAKGFSEVDVGFNTLDSDGNGRISLAEMKAYAQWRRIAATSERRAQ